MGVGIVPCLDPSESISASKAAGIYIDSDDSTLSTIVGFEVGDSFVHERAVGTSTVFIRRCARRQDKRKAPSPSRRLSGAIHCIFTVRDLTGERLGQRTMKERRKSELSGGVQRLPFS
jgi:hypothetical protein